jgi:hypothetical protein
MTIVCHSRRFIFLKTRKTAGSSIELWLARYLDHRTDLIRLGDESEQQHPDLWKKFHGLPSKIRLAAKRATLTPIFRQHMPAADVRRFVGERKWRDYRKITIVRNPWDRTISAWRWSEHMTGISRSLSDFVRETEKNDRLARAVGSPRIRLRRTAKWVNWPYYAIKDEIVADEIIKYESLEADTRSIFARFGISSGDLPRAKAGIRKPSDSLQLLTPELVERIAVLHKREIDAFGYTPPTSISASATA